MKKYEHILFDFDDTLVNHIESEKTALENTCNAFNINFTEGFRNKYYEINRQLWQNLEKGLIEKDKIITERFRLLFIENDIHKDYNDFSFKYIEEFGTTAYLIDNAKEILEYLDEKVKMSIITNGIKGFAPRRSKIVGIYDYFQDFYVSEDIGYSKPAKEYFDFVLEKGNIDPNTALIVGDSITSDMQGGINAGIDTCYFNFRNRPKGNLDITYEIKDLIELKSIIDFTL